MICFLLFRTQRYQQAEDKYQQLYKNQQARRNQEDICSFLSPPSC